ncbi:response regulator [Candidatus Berkelbacteria bacterium]|nr:response regulator [Candidatus Berkelbacteria bacterium]
MKPTILIIDDDPEIRKLYQARFKAAHFVVHLASNGDDGVKTALSEKPAVILLDLMMPVKGGLGALDILKTMPETRNIPIVIVTAYPVDEYRAKSDRSGAALFLSKAETPPGEVVAKIQKILGIKS